MDRPYVVWVYSFFVVLGILLGIAQSILVLSGAVKVTQLVYIAQIISVFLLIPQTLFIIQFFMLKKKCLIWFYISFGMLIILGLLAQRWVGTVIAAVFGWVVWDYIVHKKIVDQPLFT